MPLKNSFFMIVAFVLTCFTFAGVTQAEENFSIKGDSSSWDLPNNRMNYYGNIQFNSANVTISGEQLTAQRSVTNTNEEMHISGSPAQLKQKASALIPASQLSAGSIHYQIAAQRIGASDNVKLVQQDAEQGTVEIQGDSLSLNQASGYQLNVKGAPLRLIITNPDRPQLNASAKHLKYDQKSHRFTLSGGVSLQHQRETLNADVIIYDIQTGILQVPKSSKGQVEIIQSDRPLKAGENK